MDLGKNKKGQSNTEYSLLAALLAMAVIAILVVLGPRIAGAFQHVEHALASISVSPTP